MATFPPQAELGEVAFYPSSIRREKPHGRTISSIAVPTPRRNRVKKSQDSTSAVRLPQGCSSSCHCCTNCKSFHLLFNDIQAGSSVGDSSSWLEPKGKTIRTYENDKATKPGFWKRCLMCLLTDTDEVYILI